MRLKPHKPSHFTTNDHHNARQQTTTNGTRHGRPRAMIPSKPQDNRSNRPGPAATPAPKRRRKRDTTMSRKHSAKNAPTAPEAAQAAEARAIEAAPEAGTAPRSAGLDAILADEQAAEARKAEKAAKRAEKAAKAPREPRDTFGTWVTDMLAQAGRPIAVGTLVRVWCDAHPELGKGAKGALDARATAEAARARGDMDAAEAADKRAAEAARAQAEATTSARIYTLAKDGRIEKGERGEVKAREVQKGA